MSEVAGRPRRGAAPLTSRRFDAAVTGLGAAVALLAWVVVLADDGRSAPAWMLLAVPVIALMGRYPLLLPRTGGVEISFDAAVLVYLAADADSLLLALALWCLGVVAGQLTVDKPPGARRFNMGVSCVAGGLALLVASVSGALKETGLGELVALSAAAAVYFAVDYVLSAVSLSLENERPLAPWRSHLSALPALALFVACSSLGYLAALVARSELPSWTAVLLAVPLATILVASRALSRGEEHRRRLAASFETAKRLQVCESSAEALDVLVASARDVTATRVVLRRWEPQEGEVGALLEQDGMHEPLWLVASARRRARATAASDQAALEALATLAEEVLVKLRLVEEMAHVARHDALTGLANRTLFLDRVEHAVALSRRSGRRIAVLFCDLDGFKAVNDRFGHESGDRLLRELATRLKAGVRSGDTVARLGGDEFAVLMENIGDRAPYVDVDTVCRRLLDILSGDVEMHGRRVSVGVSIGVAISTPTDDAGALLRNADMAMYRAKSEGKGRAAQYEPALRAASLQRIELVEQLRRSVTYDQLVVHYQPVVDLASRRVTGVEALVRWQRADGLVGPDAFIPAAEESGVVVDIGRRVLDIVQRDASRLAESAGHPLAISVNVSPRQLSDPMLPEAVERASRALSGSAGLVLEMTEHVYIGDDEATLGVLRTLAEHGATLAIDDFGVGFSSIGYLQHLPVQMLKIDRSFTADVDRDERAATLVEAMVLMGAALDLHVVAEGIERLEQVERLRAVGCTSGQGFHLGRPAPLEAVLDLLVERRDRAAPTSRAAGS